MQANSIEDVGKQLEVVPTENKGPAQAGGPLSADEVPAAIPPWRPAQRTEAVLLDCRRQH